MRPSRFLSLLLPLWISLCVPSRAFADLDPPVRNQSLFVAPVAETMLRVQTARVLIADYPLLRRDFPSLNGKSEPEIDAWLIEHVGVIAQTQAAQSVVNTPIEILHRADGQPVTHPGFRPLYYNRAHVIPVDGGFIDIKGSGAPSPSHRSHGDGLATVGEAIREFIYQKMVQKIFTHAKLEFTTVANYGVIDYGFDVVHADGSKSPAGIVLRQAHERPDLRSGGGTDIFGNFFLNRENSTRVERVLRYYGMTSSGEKYGVDRDVINIQGHKNMVVDFGSYLVRPDYVNPTFAYNEIFKSNAQPLLAPGKPGWLAPNPQIRLPFTIWGYSVTGNADPKADNIWVWSHELATNIRRGNATRHDLWLHYTHMLDAGNFPPALIGAAKAAEIAACVDSSIP